eukprot:4685281-Alexandrium_andersonii.AAC.1
MTYLQACERHDGDMVDEEEEQLPEEGEAAPDLEKLSRLHEDLLSVGEREAAKRIEAKIKKLRQPQGRAHDIPARRLYSQAVHHVEQCKDRVGAVKREVQRLEDQITEMKSTLSAREDELEAAVNTK